ncbi:hypothetical protein Bbelb_350600 [Branchiostoma belcheri]|nr:hypothetical protein Bbelb_350600 [Branchiostoma belcheri]
MLAYPEDTNHRKATQKSVDWGHEVFQILSTKEHNGAPFGLRGSEESKRQTFNFQRKARAYTCVEGQLRKKDKLVMIQEDFKEVMRRFRRRHQYAEDEARKPRDRDGCRKESYGQPTLTPGLFTIFCPHGVCYGFEAMRSCESPHHPFQIFRTRFQTAPRVIVYDNSCQLHRYAMNRDPHFFKKTVFLPINSQVNEQANSGLTRIQPQLAYVSPSNFMFHGPCIVVLGTKEHAECAGCLFLLSDGRAVFTNHFSNTLRKCLERAYLDSQAFTAHSFRIGAATHAAWSGASDAQLRALGRWSSDAFKSYIAPNHGKGKKETVYDGIATRHISQSQSRPSSPLPSTTSFQFEPQPLFHQGHPSHMYYSPHDVMTIINRYQHELEQARALNVSLMRRLCPDDRIQVTLLGDGRCDSPGHNAKYCSYTFMEEQSKYIVGFELLQSTDSNSSQAMERDTFGVGLDYLLTEGLDIECMATDRHNGIRAELKKNGSTVKSTTSLICSMSQNPSRKTGTEGQETLQQRSLSMDKLCIQPLVVVFQDLWWRCSSFVYQTIDDRHAGQLTLLTRNLTNDLQKASVPALPRIGSPSGRRAIRRAVGLMQLSLERCIWSQGGSTLLAGKKLLDEKVVAHHKDALFEHTNNFREENSGSLQMTLSRSLAMSPPQMWSRNETAVFKLLRAKPYGTSLAFEAYLMWMNQTNDWLQSLSAEDKKSTRSQGEKEHFQMTVTKPGKKKHTFSSSEKSKHLKDVLENNVATTSFESVVCEYVKVKESDMMMRSVQDVRTKLHTKLLDEREKREK